MLAAGRGGHRDPFKDARPSWLWPPPAAGEKSAPAARSSNRKKAQKLPTSLCQPMIRYSTPRAKTMGSQLTSRPDPIRIYLDSSDIDNLTDARKLAKDARLGETAEV
jgi:hypothetical protein